MARTVRAAVAVVAVTVACLVFVVSPADATPPNIPSYSTAVSRLNALTVAAESHQSSYDRDLFPHWITITGTCNTREQVLKRDGTNVTVNGSCYPTSGSWYSPYDGARWTNPADVDIDHMVPLAEAWASGAWAWSTSRRQAYANDLGGPELWAVTDNVNQAKGEVPPVCRRLGYLDGSGSEWMVAGWCCRCHASSCSSGERPPSPSWMRRGLYQPSM